MPVNSGDTAWILVSSALVLLMTPGLALFYGGMARRKNLLSTIMMSFAMMCLIGIIWVLWGYSIGFGSDIGGFLGSLNFFGLSGVSMLPSDIYATSVPHLAFMAFQGMFAIITVALITGAVVERIKFSALVVFSAIWVTIVYSPVCHWVWGNGGWLGGIGALDFAGGAVVHINAGVSALALVLLLGRRKGFPGTAMEANSIPLVTIGAGLLWFGWFGFNAGSSLAADGLAANAFVTTNISAAAAGLTWMMLSWIHRRPSLLGTVTGAVAGLVAITPAAGFVTPMAAIPIGIVVSVISYYAVKLMKDKLGFDDSLDVFAVHGVGGIWGALATGIFASESVGGVSGLIEGNIGQLGTQVISILVVGAFAFVLTLIIGKLVDITIGLRVTEEEETIGLDIAQHGERAYGGLLK
ncbi:MAG: ammonia channel protein [Chloroflexi bacterium RBG_13_46_14]|nr:MAG: ammonia channel protein [Chloroflexi bacterium RBG_13_46_14]